VCRQADSDPRHDHGVGDTLLQPHLDCCRSVGCPDGSCPIITSGAEDLRGEDLRSHLTDPTVVAANAEALDARDDETRTYTTDTVQVFLQAVSR
jgi:hypothetical protein